MGTLTNPAYKTGPDFGHAGDVKIIDSDNIAVAVGDIDLNDLVKVFRAKKGFVVTGALLQSTDLDSSTGAVLALQLAHGTHLVIRLAIRAHVVDAELAGAGLCGL